MHTFISEIEKMTTRIAKDFEQSEEDETYEIEVSDGVMERCWLARDHKGISDGSYCLDEIFLSYYPSLHRASALLTMYGLMEKYFQDLVGYMVEYAGKKYSYKPGVGTVRSCLNFFIVNFKCSSEKDESLDSIRLVRNIVAHNAARIEMDGKPNTEKLLAYIKNESRLDLVGNEVLIKKGYLEFVLAEFSECFKLIAHVLKGYDEDRGVPLIKSSAEEKS